MSKSNNGNDTKTTKSTTVDTSTTPTEEQRAYSANAARSATTSVLMETGQLPPRGGRSLSELPGGTPGTQISENEKAIIVDRLRQHGIEEGQGCCSIL